MESCWPAKIITAVVRKKANRKPLIKEREREERESKRENSVAETQCVYRSGALVLDCLLG